MRAFLSILAMIASAALSCYCLELAFNEARWVLDEMAATHLDVTVDKLTMLVILIFALGYGRRR